MNLRKLRIGLLLYAAFDLFFGGYCGGFLPLTQLSAAQFTTVSGTVTDPNGLPYANGTITATLVISGSPTLNGLAYSPPSQPTGLNSSGSFVMQLADNTQLSPGGSQWKFQVCSAAGTVQPSGGKGPQCFTAGPVTISGASQNITATLQAAVPSLGPSPPVCVGCGAITSSASGAPYGLDIFGTSISVGVGALPYINESYAVQLSNDVAKTASQSVNISAGGNECPDVAQTIYANLVPGNMSNPVTVMEIGANDGYIRSSPISAANQALFTACYESAMAWGAIPRQNKVFAQDSQCVKTGAWANTTNWVSGVGMTDTVLNDTMSCTVITNGAPLYVAYWWADASTGTMTVTVDGGPATVLSAEPVTINTQNGVTTDIPLARISGIAAGTHTVLFKVTSSGQTVAVYWMGSAFPVRTPGPPTVYTLGVMYSGTNTYVGGANAGSSTAITSTLNSLVQSMTSTLASDGLPLVFVDLRSGGPANPNTDTGFGWINSTTDFAATATGQGGLNCTNTATGNTQNLHPNGRTIGSTSSDGCGQDHVRQAIEYYMQPTVGLAPGQLVCYAGNQASPVTPNGTAMDMFSTFTIGGNAGGGCLLPANLMALKPVFVIKASWSHAGTTSMSYQYGLNGTAAAPSSVLIGAPGWSSTQSGGLFQTAQITITGLNAESGFVDQASSGAAAAFIATSSTQGANTTEPTTSNIVLHLTCIGGTTDTCTGKELIVQAYW